MSAHRLLGRAEDDESGGRSFGLVAVVVLHVALVAALLQVSAVRNALADAAPVFVSFITEQPPHPEEPPPPPVLPRRQPLPLLVSQRVAPPTAEFIAPPPPPEPVVEANPIETPQPVAAPVSAAPPPRLVTNVEYVRRPAPEYPLVSRRLGEQGRVVVRVLINPLGRAERVELQEASPYRRLNDSALKAVQEALYRPYTENGVAQSVWALVPLAFELGR